MIVKQYQIENFKLDKHNIYLLYGKNEGFQNEIIEKKFLKNFDGTIDKYEQEDVINNYEEIVSSILNKSLFENKKIIIVNRVSDKLINFIKYLSDNKVMDIKIIIKAGILDKKSKLRNLFEKAQDLVCIPFYEDDNKSLLQIINNFLIKNNIKLSRESINLIIERVNGNRISLYNELNKILNYSFSNKNIDFDTIQKLSNLSGNYEVNKLADYYLEKNKKNVAKILNENNYSDEDCILILRTLLMKSKRLLYILEKYEEDKNLDQIISTIKPPIFWKDKNSLKKQANNWVLEELKKKIYKISEVEFLTKTNSKSSMNIVSDFIVNY